MIAAVGKVCKFPTEIKSRATGHAGPVRPVSGFGRGLRRTGWDFRERALLERLRSERRFVDAVNVAVGIHQRVRSAASEELRRRTRSTGHYLCRAAQTAIREVEKADQLTAAEEIATRMEAVSALAAA